MQVLKGIDFLNEPDLPEFVQEISELFRNVTVNSCFHPNEFPIGAYRVTSLCTTESLGEGSDIHVMYLDSLNGRSLPPTYPHGSNKNKGTFLKQILKIINDPEISVTNKIRKSEEIIDLYYSGNQSDRSHVVKFCLEILDEIGILGDFKSYFNGKKFESFIYFIFEKNHQDFIAKIKKGVRSRLLQQRYRGHEFPHNELCGIYQNAILDIIYRNAFDDKIRSQVNSTGVFTEEGGVNIPFDGDIEDLTLKQQAGFKKIFDDTKGLKFFISYVNQLTEGREKVEIGTYYKSGKLVRIFASVIENELLYFTSSDGEMSSNSLQEILCGDIEVDRYSLNGNMTLMFLVIGRGINIGSERHLPQLIINALSENKEDFGESYDSYIESILERRYFGDLEGGERGNPRLAGAEFITPSDMTKHAFLSGKFTRDQVSKAIANFNEVPELDLEKFFDDIVRTFSDRIFQSKEAEILFRKYDSLKNTENFMILMKYLFFNKKS